jgi:hypothetical protein
MYWLSSSPAQFYTPGQAEPSKEGGMEWLWAQIEESNVTNYNMSVVAPPETQKAIVFASIAPNTDAATQGARSMTVREGAPTSLAHAILWVVTAPFPDELFWEAPLRRFVLFRDCLGALTPACLSARPGSRVSFKCCFCLLEVPKVVQW